MQVVWSDSLKAKAIDQWTRELPVKAARGNIVDVNGELLAGTASSFAVYIRTRCVTNPISVSKTLSKLFGVDEEELLQKINASKSSEITVKRQVSKSEIEKLTAYSLDGVYYSVDKTRIYPYGSLLSQTLGYTSTDGSGASGLEAYYDKYLKGSDGEILYEADLVGKDLPQKTPSYVPAANGFNLRLNIDLETQLIVETALERVCLNYTPKSASAIVIEPSSGKIRAIATLPSFDLNNVPRDDIEALNSLSRSPIIVDSYEPGSTFKIVTSIANISEHLKGNSNALSLDYVFNGNRFRTVGGTKIKCWSSHANGKHANQSLSEALNNSCNPCFVDIALSLGKENLYEYIQKLNFGSVTGIDFYGEALGMVLPVSSVTEGDLARIAFGQTIAVTPLQLAAAACAIVNGGNYYAPRLVAEIYDELNGTAEIINPILKNKVLDEKACLILKSYLERVVSEGSGKQAYIEGYRVGGKTGTAQKYIDGKISQGKYVMSFMGFFPANEPKYLALVLVDEPVGGSYGSTVAAPVVKEIFQGIIDCKKIKAVT